MKKKLRTVLITCALICPLFLFSQTRICLINECRYSDNTNKFLKLQNSQASPTPLMSGPAGTHSNAPIEQYLFYGRAGIRTKSGIKNRQATDMVTAESGRRLTNKGYDTVIPTNEEMTKLWTIFNTTKKKHSKDVKKQFRQYLCEFYQAEMLVALTASPFDMEIGSSKTRDDAGKVVNAKMSLSCVNTWDLYSPKKQKIIKSFQTTGNSETYWTRITRYNISSSLARKEITWVDGYPEYEGSWDFIPYITETAANAAEYFERNL